MEIDEARNIAVQFLKGKRLRHAESTGELAAAMGEELDVDPVRLQVAGLLHDIAKPLNKTELLIVARRYRVRLDPIMEVNRSLIHAPLAAAILRQEYGLKDREILRAIACHTTGDSKLSLLEKIVYAADFLDPKRAFPEQKNAWQLMGIDFHRGLLYIIGYSVRHVLLKRRALHPMSVRFYNETLLRVHDSNRPLQPLVLGKKSGTG